jgi:hypothetical protein
MAPLGGLLRSNDAVAGGAEQRPEKAAKWGDRTADLSLQSALLLEVEVEMLTMPRLPE